MDPTSFDACKTLVDAVCASKQPFPVIAKTVVYNGAHKYTTEQLEYVTDAVKRYPDMEWYKRVQRKPRTQFSIDGVEYTDDNYFIVNNLNHSFEYHSDVYSTLLSKFFLLF